MRKRATGKISPAMEALKAELLQHARETGKRVFINLMKGKTKLSEEALGFIYDSLDNARAAKKKEYTDFVEIKEKK